MAKFERIRKSIKNSRLDRKFCSREEANATVYEIFPSGCRAMLDGASELTTCVYRRATLLSPQSDVNARKERTPVCVGDRVEVVLQGSSGVVQRVAPRINELSRVAPGREKSHMHVLVANIDLLCIVTSVHEPEFSPGIVDRYLIAAESQGIETALVVNKADLLREGDEQLWNIYKELGYRVELVSASQGDTESVEHLRTYMHAKKVAFSGHSGVGKTSLLSLLVGRKTGEVGSVNESSGKGRHTTTQAMVVWSSEESLWIDTPGVRSFGLADIPPEELKDYFRELKDLRCADPFCLHLEGTEGCVAKALPRVESYRRIYHSLMEGEY